MNLTFVSTGLFPDTHAASIRQSTLAKGVAAQGHNVRFLVLSAQNWEGKNSINYFGVQFQQLNNYRGTNKILKHYNQIRAIFKAKKIVKQQAKQKKIDAVVVFSFWHVHILPVYILVRKACGLGISVFHEITELPYILGYTPKELNFYEKNFLPKLRGIFVISDKINDYVRQFNTATQKLLTVVDLTFFKTNKPSPYPFPYIGYCGTISGTKDGVPILIEAFAAISPRYPDLRLVLVGNNTNKAAIKETTDAIAAFGLGEKVIFTGLVDRDMMPVILGNAQILVVSKPDNVQNSGNFPIKIGEYLATGLPVVVTSVGEISTFIKDGESGFLARPDSAASFAQKMDEALANPDEAKLIGENGRRIAETLFDYNIQAKIMIDYFSKTYNNHE